jgi:hypothetical protein
MRDDRRKRAMRVMTIGAIVFALCALLTLTPIALGAKIGRFVVAAAVVGIVIALSLMLNGAIDWWRR